MLKKIAIGFVVLSLTTYLLGSVIFLSRRATGRQKCSAVQVEVLNKTADAHFDEKDVVAFLNENQLNPVGWSMAKIHTRAVETALETEVLVQNAEVYKTVGGAVKINVTMRTPILRVIANGKNYYIDDVGAVMPIPADFATHVPVATGNVSEAFAMEELYKFVVSLHGDSFWDDLTEQINVLLNLDIELIPKVGDHVILLGKMADYPENLSKLRLFYEKGLNKVGWNRYSMINLKYKNQVVCTKKTI